jgi:hypothetical protein
VDFLESVILRLLFAESVSDIWNVCSKNALSFRTLKL